jgi:hypothetical protein
MFSAPLSSLSQVRLLFACHYSFDQLFFKASGLKTLCWLHVYELYLGSGLLWEDALLSFHHLVRMRLQRCLEPHRNQHL